MNWTDVYDSEKKNINTKNGPLAVIIGKRERIDSVRVKIRFPVAKIDRVCQRETLYAHGRPIESQKL